MRAATPRVAMKRNTKKIKHSSYSQVLRLALTTSCLLNGRGKETKEKIEKVLTWQNLFMNNQLEYANEELVAWKYNETMFVQYLMHAYKIIDKCIYT